MNLNKKLLPSFAESILLIFLAGLSSVFIWYSENRGPVHYNFKGKPDAYGSQYAILVIPAIGIALYIFIRWVKRFRSYFNYPVRITSENKDEQEILALKLLDLYCLITLIVFNLLLIHLICNSIFSIDSGVWIWGPVFFAAYLLPLIHYLRKAGRSK